MMKLKVHPLMIAAIAVASLTTTVIAAAKGEIEPKVIGSLSAKGLSKLEFTKVARLSLDEAAKIAKDKVAGSIISAGLENEDGFLVYAVNVASNQSGLHEILVDAGNGKVLADMHKGHGKADDEEDGERDDD